MILKFSFLIAVPLGFVVTTPGETLHTLRPQIHKFTSGREYDKQQLSKNWQYLDGKAPP